MKDNLIQRKSYEFSLRIIRVYRELTEKKKEFVLSKQVLRSGTAIGAIIEEAIGAQSRKDFTSKIAIAYKEARETRYWLRLLRDSRYITAEQAESYLDECESILRIIGKIQSSVRKNP